MKGTILSSVASLLLFAQVANAEHAGAGKAASTHRETAPTPRAALPSGKWTNNCLTQVGNNDTDFGAGSMRLITEFKEGVLTQTMTLFKEGGCKGEGVETTFKTPYTVVKQTGDDWELKYDFPKEPATDKAGKLAKRFARPVIKLVAKEKRIEIGGFDYFPAKD